MSWWILAPLGIAGVILYIMVAYLIFIALMGTGMMMTLVFGVKPSRLEDIITTLIALFWPIALPIAAVYTFVMTLFNITVDWLHERTRRK